MSWRINSPKYLLSHWPLNGHAEDLIRKKNGTWSGTDDYEENQFGIQAAKFNGSSYIGGFTESNFDINTTFTLSAWIKTTDSGNSLAIISKGKSGDTFNYLFSMDVTNAIELFVFGLSDTNLVGNTVINDGKYHHIAAVYDGAQTRLHVDGDLDASESATGTPTVDDHPFYIGARESAAGGVEKQFNGQIGDVRIYTTGLTTDEIHKLWKRDHL